MVSASVFTPPPLASLRSACCPALMVVSCVGVLHGDVILITELCERNPETLEQFRKVKGKSTPNASVNMPFPRRCLTFSPPPVCTCL